MLKFYLKSILIVLLLLMGDFQQSGAQYRIPLDSVAKITFASSAPWWGGASYLKVEAVPEDGQWKIYHAESLVEKQFGYAKDSMRRYLRDLPRKNIATLLELIAKTDTVLHPELFNPVKEKLVAQMDHIFPLLTTQQRREFVKVLNSKNKLDTVITKVVSEHVAFQSDLSGYYISITTKGGRKYDVTGYANYQVPAHLPWTIGKIKSFDPRISFIFDEALYGDKYERFQNTRFYSEVVNWLEIKYLGAKFMMQNLEKQAPLTYEILSKNFSVTGMWCRLWLFRKKPIPLDSVFYTGTFRSAKLQPYVNIAFGFKATDTAAVNAGVRYADTLAGVWGDGIPLFAQLLGHKDASLLTKQGYLGQKNDYLNALKKNFPNLKQYNPKQIFLLILIGTDDIRSVWILLPDHTLILCKYFYWDAKPPATTPFLGLDASLIRKHYAHSARVCIHLDASGKLIKDYGEVEYMP